MNPSQRDIWRTVGDALKALFWVVTAVAMFLLASGRIWPLFALITWVFLLNKRERHLDSPLANAIGFVLCAGLLLVVLAHSTGAACTAHNAPQTGCVGDVDEDVTTT